MLNLMIIGRFYPPTPNGLADHTALLVECLTQDFESVTLVAEALDSQSTLSRGSRRVNYRSFNKVEDLTKVTFQAIEDTQPDFIVFQYVPHMWGRAGIAPQASLLPLKIYRKYGVPVATFAHELFYDWSLSPKRFLLSMIHRAQLFSIASGSKAMIVTNEYRRRNLAKLWPKKVLRIPAGNVSARKPEDQRRRTYRWPYITWYGTLSDGQQLESLVETFCHVADNYPSLRLVCVGAFDSGAPVFRNLTALCAGHGLDSRLVIRGFVEDDELSDILSGSTVNVHVNLSGPSGRRGVIAAYLRAGRPVIAIDGKETDPEFIDKRNILLVPRDNVDAFRVAMESVLSEPLLKGVLENGARQLFADMFSDRAIGRALAQVVGSSSPNP